MKNAGELPPHLHIPQSSRACSLQQSSDMFPRFVHHTSSLVSLSQGSRQVCDRLSRHSLLIIRKNIKPFTFFISFTTLCFPTLVAPHPVFDLFPLSFFLIELCLNLHVRFQSPQCCKRKLVAMLMSLFDALRASSASILEKPISTSRATCWDDGTR